jgi:adenosine deaminase
MSAVQLRALNVFAGLDSHNVRRLPEAGVCVTVNSDDPPYFGGYINANFAAVQEKLGMGDYPLWEKARNSFAAAFMPDDPRKSTPARSIQDSCTSPAEAIATLITRSREIAGDRSCRTADQRPRASRSTLRSRTEIRQPCCTGQQGP